jgi:hypothetical protein
MWLFTSGHASSKINSNLLMIYCRNSKLFKYNFLSSYLVIIVANSQNALFSLKSNLLIPTELAPLSKAIFGLAPAL